MRSFDHRFQVKIQFPTIKLEFFHSVFGWSGLNVATRSLGSREVLTQSAAF